MDDYTLKRLLDSYFCQKVQLKQREKRQALDVWQGKVNAILQRVEAKDDRFKLKEVYGGSYYERVKVKEPNEFDIMLEMEELHLSGGDQYDSCEDNLTTEPPIGYTTVMIDQGEEKKWRHGGCIPQNQHLLNATNVKALFRRYVHEAIMELGYSRCIEVDSSGPAVTLKITNGNSEYSIDLTLAIKDESWPDDADEWKTRQRGYTLTQPILVSTSLQLVISRVYNMRGCVVSEFTRRAEGWPSSNIVATIVQDGCHLVAKRPKQLTATRESEYFWLYSFSAAEKKLALQGDVGEEGTCRKKILRILKSLREQHRLTPLTSYHLKTIMFYEREENPNLLLWKEDKLAIRFKGALARLQRCLQQRRCPHYFIKDINLFDSRFDGRYQFLLTWIDNFQRNPENYLRVR